MARAGGAGRARRAGARGEGRCGHAKHARYPEATRREAASLAAGIVSPLYEAGLDVELLPSGGANQSSLLREVNQVMTGKALVVPEPYARQLFDLPRVPLDVPPLHECVVTREGAGRAVDLFLRFAARGWR